MRFAELTELAPDTTLDADVCIVGSGPAGLTVARELAGSGLRVVLLESGLTEPDADADALNAIENIGDPRVLDQTEVRNRILGGTSHTWSGRAAVFDETDFAARSWVDGSGWPLPRDEVMRFMPRTMDHLGNRIPDNLDAAFVARATVREPALDPRDVVPYAWTTVRDDADQNTSMRFGPRAVKESMPGVTGFVGATVTRIATDDDVRRVTGVEVTGRDGRIRAVRSGSVVLAGGAIENARMLLASNRRAAAGIGNDHDQVGRHLMDHLRGPVGLFARRDHVRAQRLFGSVEMRGGGAITPGYALSPERQRAEELLNCAVWVFPRAASDDPWAALRAVRRAPGDAARSIAKHPLLLVGGAVPMLVQHRLPPRLLDALELHVIVEQLPDPSNRVTLAERTDAYGVPLSRIDWHVAPQERRTVRRTAELVVAGLRAAAAPAPALLPWVEDDALPFGLPDVAHPAGSTRMSAQPADGVVDTDCMVHGVDGLFVAGSSVFPTSGHANPTQMIVALAVRLADHLKARAA